MSMVLDTRRKYRAIRTMPTAVFWQKWCWDLPHFFAVIEMTGSERCSEPAFLLSEILFKELPFLIAGICQKHMYAIIGFLSGKNNFFCHWRRWRIVECYMILQRLNEKSGVIMIRKTMPMNILPQTANNTGELSNNSDTKNRRQSMKATGIVRRIDDLGWVVIPKEIRRAMRIRVGAPSLITLTRDIMFCSGMQELAGRRYIG